MATNICDSFSRGVQVVPVQETNRARRDMFACAALTGLIPGDSLYDLNVLADEAFKIADAMMKISP